MGDLAEIVASHQPADHLSIMRRCRGVDLGRDRTCGVAVGDLAEFVASHQSTDTNNFLGIYLDIDITCGVAIGDLAIRTRVVSHQPAGIVIIARDRARGIAVANLTFVVVSYQPADIHFASDVAVLQTHIADLTC